LATAFECHRGRNFILGIHKENDWARTSLTRRTNYIIVYVMNTKLTLRMDEALVRRAKAEASRRGKSVSQMVGEFVASLGSPKRDKQKLPPITASLVGVLKGHRVSESDYKRHLREKHL